MCEKEKFKRRFLLSAVEGFSGCLYKDATTLFMEERQCVVHAGESCVSCLYNYNALICTFKLVFTLYT